MKLPVIRSVTEYIDENSAGDVEKAIAVLEHTSQARGFSDAELDAIGEVISNLYGALEVTKSVESGTPKSEALNGFMKRVMGSIDR